MTNTSLLTHSLRNKLLGGLLVVAFIHFQPPSQASAAEPLPYKVIEDIRKGSLLRLTLECLNLPTSTAQTGSSSAPSEPILRRIRLEQTLRFRDTVNIPGVDGLEILTESWLLGDERMEEIYGQRSQYIQCGQPIQIVWLQERLKQARQVLADNQRVDAIMLGAETSEGMSFAEAFEGMSFFDVVPRVENNDTLVLSIERRRIHTIKIATWCDWTQWAVDRRGTVPINGQKPDALIRQTLGIAPGDRLPSQATDEAAMEKIWSLGLFRVVSSGLGIENDADKLDWIVCVQQKSEAELVYDEAQRIGVQDSTEAVKQAIGKYKEALLLFRQPKTAPRKYDRPPDQEMKEYRFMSFGNMQGAIFGKLFPTEADCLVKIAANYTILNEFYQALHYYSQALPVMQQLNDQDGEVTVLTEMGDIHSTLGDRQQAQRYYEKALTIRLEALRSKGRKPE